MSLIFAILHCIVNPQMYDNKSVSPEFFKRFFAFRTQIYDANAIVLTFHYFWSRGYVAKPKAIILSVW